MKAEYEQTINRGLLILAVIVMAAIIVMAFMSCTTVRCLVPDVSDTIYQYAGGGVWVIEDDTTYKWK